MRGTRQYVLDPQLLRDYSTSDPDLYRAYLEAMTPATLDLVELVQPYINMYGGLSTQDMLHYLEPFLVYADDLTYTQMNRLRYFIRQRITQYRRQFQEDRDRYLKIAGGYSRVSQPLENIVNPVQDILDTGSNYDSHFTEVYRIPALLRKKEAARPLTGSELLVDILGRDQARLFAMLLRSRTLTYVVSEAILSSALEEYDEEQKKTKNGTPTTASADCRRQFLTKRYTSLAELQKDNHHEEVYYDTDFDDTPYKLLDLYKADLPEKSTDLESPAMKEFLELLEENLIRKHGVDRTSASELATTLVRKKKPVRDGEYALLEIAQEIREEDLGSEAPTKTVGSWRPNVSFISVSRTSGSKTTPSTKRPLLICRIWPKPPSPTAVHPRPLPPPSKPPRVPSKNSVSNVPRPRYVIRWTMPRPPCTVSGKNTPLKRWKSGSR